MLVLARRVGEVVLIGQDVEIAIVKIRHSRVLVGITAPPLIPILRLEIRDSTNALRLLDTHPAIPQSGKRFVWT